MTFPVNQILGGCPSAGRLALLKKTVFLDGGRPPNTNHDDAGRPETHFARGSGEGWSGEERRVLNRFVVCRGRSTGGPTAPRSYTSLIGHWPISDVAKVLSKDIKLGGACQHVVTNE